MPDRPTTSELGQAIQEVSERASLLVREEIELAKAEMTEKVTKLVKGAVVGDRRRHLRRRRADLPAALARLGHLRRRVRRHQLRLGRLPDRRAASCSCSAASPRFLALRFSRAARRPRPPMAIEEAQLIKADRCRPRGPRTPDRRRRAHRVADPAARAEARR